jgi:hypothetical protein
LSPATLLADRRAAVLALKGLCRDHKQDVGDRALPGLLDVLASDAEIDVDIAKAVLESLIVLCEADAVHKELSFKYTDTVLATDKVINILFTLLADTSFYTRFSAIQFLAILLHNRRQVVQAYFLKAPNGTRNVIATLEDKREIIRNGKDWLQTSARNKLTPRRGIDHVASFGCFKSRHSEGSCFRRCI